MRHKTALTMAASVVGVMLAGSAVLAANMGILSQSAELGSLDPLATTPSTSVPASTTGSTSIPGELVAYQVEGVGIVTLLRNDDILTVDSVEVGDSWTWESKPDPGHPGGIILVFTSGGQTIEFTAWVEDGEVMVTVKEVPDDSVIQDDDDQSEDDSGEDHESEEDDD